MTILQAVLLPFMGFNLLYPPVIETGFVAPKKAEIAPVHRVYAINDEGFSPCSCVSGAKYLLGVSQGIGCGNANQIKSNTKQIKVSNLILLNEGEIGHVAVVLNWSDEHITIEEYNQLPCQKSIRILPRNYPLIRGFRDINMLE